jgi:hypothetical protein
MRTIKERSPNVQICSFVLRLFVCLFGCLLRHKCAKLKLNVDEDNKIQLSRQTRRQTNKHTSKQTNLYFAEHCWPGANARPIRSPGGMKLSPQGRFKQAQDSRTMKKQSAQANEQASKHMSKQAYEQASTAEQNARGALTVHTSQAISLTRFGGLMR